MLQHFHIFKKLVPVRYETWGFVIKEKCILLLNASFSSTLATQSVTRNIGKRFHVVISQTFTKFILHLPLVSTLFLWHLMAAPFFLCYINFLYEFPDGNYIGFTFRFSFRWFFRMNQSPVKLLQTCRLHQKITQRQ